jgi:hypothetical protein
VRITEREDKRATEGQPVHRPLAEEIHRASHHLAVRSLALLGQVPLFLEN